MASLLDGDYTNGNRRMFPRVNGTSPKMLADDVRKIKKRMSQRMQRTGSVPHRMQRTMSVPQRKQRAMSLQPISELLLDVMVWEILIRLPVESLVRFKLVSKAWYAIISDPVFVRAHLQCSKEKQHRNPSSFLVTPQIYLEPNPSGLFSTNIRFYLWSLQQDDMSRSSSSATLLYGRQFPTGEFGLVSQMAHCDGLVLLPTNTNTYVFNPATRDVVALPRCHRNMLQHPTCLPIGLGLDVSTGTYKVSRSFYRSGDYSSVAMGMEVFTINGEEGNWRETLLDPPYPIVCPQTAIHCKGSLFYFIDKKNQRCPPQALLRFCLQDETFGITPLLNNVYPTVEDDDIVLHELDGELCATFFSKCVQRVLVWMARDIVNPEWDCHYVINVSDHCCPVASLSITGGFLLRRGHCLIRYYMKAHGVKEEDTFDMDDLRFLGPSEDTLGHAWENLCVFELLHYTASLVPITPKASLQAS
ncbi:hypothetical protein ACQJBY_021856 [Aegilops geniculata]